MKFLKTLFVAFGMLGFLDMTVQGISHGEIKIIHAILGLFFS